MESPAAICCTGWAGLSTDDAHIGLRSASDSLSSCSSNWQYVESVDGDEDNDKRSSTKFTKSTCVDDCDSSQSTLSATMKRVSDDSCRSSIEPIEPPLEFQDVPPYDGVQTSLEELAEGLVDRIVCDAVSRSEKELTARSCRTPDLHSSRRPASRNSLNSRLSSSHNSLSVPAANKADDSSFITSAMSHDVLDLYNMSLDGDIYTLPVDSLKPSCSQRLKRQQRHRKRRRNTVFVQVNNTEAKTDNLVNPLVTDSIGVRPSTVSVVRQNTVITNSSTESDGYRSPVYNKRHSLPGSSLSDWAGRMQCNEPIHMTLHEVRQFLHNLYSSASSNRSWYGRHEPVNDPATNEGVIDNVKTVSGELLRSNDIGCVNNNNICSNKNNLMNNRKSRTNSSHSRNGFTIKIKNRKSRSFDIEPDVKSINNKNNKRSCFNNGLVENNNNNKSDTKTHHQNPILSSNTSSSNGDKSHGSGRSKNSFSYTLKQTLCNIFRFRRGEMSVSSQCHHSVTDTMLVLGVGESDADDQSGRRSGPPPFAKRALPPLPARNGDGNNGREYDAHDQVDGEGVDAVNADGDDQTTPEDDREVTVDFASSIEKVKDYGWYWGPISGETAEKVLSNEPDGSFIVRDSSDDHYIFSLTFKLNGVIRHVRIEHDQGNFSFGSCAKFKSRTIVEFIENAVEHSRSGRYLFFLHRRPIHGPMRVQLLHPVSRFKQVQSLQHMCRFVILKVVRRDLIPSLPLPRRIISYLNSPYYYCEHPSLPASDDVYPSASPSLHLFSFVPPNS